MEQKSRSVLRAEQLWGLLQFIQRIAAVLIVLLAIYVYINSVLSLFPWTRAIGNTLLKYLLAPLKVIGTGILNFLPDFFFLLILFFVIRYLLGAIQGLFSAVAKGHISFKGFDADWAWPTYRIVRIVIIAFALVVAYPYIPGSQSDAFKAMTLFIGVVFSIGSSSFIANIIAGYMLTYRRAFRLGDFGITYEINAYYDTPERMPALYSELHEHIQDVFNEYGDAIMTASYVADPAEPSSCPRRNGSRRRLRPP